MATSESEHDLTPRWRELSDTERQVAYSPSSCTGGTFEPFIAEYATRSADVRQAAEQSGPPLQLIRYGPAESQTVDLQVPDVEGAAVPLVVFIHGGYWQLLSKNESLFGAPHCLANGIAYAAVDYTLAPIASLDEIVAECRSALKAIRAACPAAGVDPDRIVVCGSSAGAHLSAMVGLGTDDHWRPAAVGLLSGVFELEPLLSTEMNVAIGLDLEAAKRNSPMLADLADFPPALIAWGDNETDEFKRQSRALGELIAAKDVPVNIMEIAGRNHFDVVFDLCDASTTLGAALHQLVAETEIN